MICLVDYHTVSHAIYKVFWPHLVFLGVNALRAANSCAPRQLLAQSGNDLANILGWHCHVEDIAVLRTHGSTELIFLFSPF